MRVGNKPMVFLPVSPGGGGNRVKENLKTLMHGRLSEDRTLGGVAESSGRMSWFSGLPGLSLQVRVSPASGAHLLCRLRRLPDADGICSGASGAPESRQREPQVLCRGLPVAVVGPLPAATLYGPLSPRHGSCICAHPGPPGPFPRPWFA